MQLGKRHTSYTDQEKSYSLEKKAERTGLNPGKTAKERVFRLEKTAASVLEKTAALVHEKIVKGRGFSLDN